MRIQGRRLEVSQGRDDIHTGGSFLPVFCCCAVFISVNAMSMPDFDPTHEPVQENPCVEAPKVIPAGGAPEGGEDIGGQICNILENVEGQLGRLRDIQREQDEQIRALDERQRLLGEAEEALEELTREVEGREEALAADRRTLEEERGRFESERHEAYRQLEEKSGGLDAYQHELDARSDELNQRDETNTREREAIDSARAALEEDRAFVEGERVSLESARAELSSQRDGWEEQCRDIRARQDEQNAELQGWRQSLEDRQQELHAEGEKLSGQREALSDEQETFDSEKESWAERRRAAEAGMDEREEVLDSRRAELEHQQEAIEAEWGRQGRDARELQGERMEIGEREADFEVRSGEMQDRIAGAESLVEERTREIQELTGRHEQVSRASRETSEALEQAERRIGEVTSRLGEAESNVEVANERACGSEAALEEARRGLTQRESQIAGLEETIRENEAKLESAADAAEAAGYEQEIVSLKEQIASLVQGADDAQEAAEETERALREARDCVSAATSREVEYEARVAEREAELEQVRAELQKLESRPNQTPEENMAALGAAIEEADTLREDVTELETKLAAAESGQNSAPAAESHALKDLRAKAKQLAEVSQHINRRQARLRKLRGLLRDRAGGAPPQAAGMEEHAGNMRRIDTQRQELAELKTVLADAERRMIRRWARPRAVTTVVWVFFLALLSAGVSWVAADHYFPAVVSASVTLEPKSRQRGELPEEAAARWRSWHADLIEDDSFRQVLAKRMEERRIDEYAEVASLTERLDSDLTIDTGDTHSMTLTMAGTDPDEVAYMLDTLVATVTKESTRQLRKRTDNAWAVARGERKVEGQLRYCALNPIAIEDQRLYYAGSIFGGVFSVVLVLVALVYSRLMKAKREFDEDGELFEYSAADAYNAGEAVPTAS